MNLPDGYFLQENKYQLTHTIGQGGFGITYLGVWNTEVKGELGTIKTKVPICIKEYFFKDYCYREKNSHAVRVHSETGEKLFEKFKEKLIKEANILSAVHHPHIVNVLEVFEENNTAYIIMEYIKGCSLKYMLDKEEVLPENKVLKYTHQIGNALDFVHDKNIVHLDIKPGNILIDCDDNARLIDFGVSKRYDIEEQETSTTTLTLSKGFASIEQYDDEGTQIFSPCPDIYSLGATMYNLITGVVPVESILRVTKKMLPASAYNSNITPKTEKAILKAMEVKPEDRFQTIKELLATIEIPPYELTENTLIETRQFIDDDSTEVMSTRSSGTTPSTSDDDDRTIVTSSMDSKSTTYPTPKNKAKRRVLLSAGILLFAFIGYAVYSYFLETPLQNKPPGIEMPGSRLSHTNNNNISVNPADSIQTKAQQTPEQSASNNFQSQTTPENTNNTNSQTTTSPSGNTVLITNNHGFTEEEISAFKREYQNLISSHETKIRHGDFLGAREDLLKARDIVKKTNIESTYEVDKLLDICSEKQKQKLIKERLADYETIYKFGELMVAYNKKTKRFGAINAEGKEIIPCKYVTANRTLKGTPEFQIEGEDELVDIYNDEGDSIDLGVKRSY